MINRLSNKHFNATDPRRPSYNAFIFIPKSKAEYLNTYIGIREREYIPLTTSIIYLNQLCNISGDTLIQQLYILCKKLAE